MLQYVQSLSMKPVVRCNILVNLLCVEGYQGLQVARRLTGHDGMIIH